MSHHHHLSREDNDRTWVQKIQIATSSQCTTRSPSYVLKSASQLLRIPTEPGLGKTQVGVQVANLWSWLRSEFGDLIELDDLIPPKKGTGGGLRAVTTPLPRWADIHKALFAVSGNCRVQQSKKKRHKNNAVSNINYFSKKNCDDIKTLKVWKLLFVDRGPRWRYIGTKIITVAEKTWLCTFSAKSGEKLK